MVAIVAVVATLGAWRDQPHVQVDHPQTFVPVEKPWDPVVELSRHGRRLDGFRPTVAITGADGKRTYSAKDLGAGRYSVQVVFPHVGAYTYTIVVANQVAARGTIFAVPE